MHEISFIENILMACTEASRKNNLQQVTRVSLEIGKLYQLVPDLLYFAFETAVAGTIFEGAELDIEWKSLTGLCSDCNQSFPVEEFVFICPGCGSFNLSLISGKELLIKSIEGE